MDTVDRWLAQDRYWPLLLVIGSGVVLSGDGEHRPLWSGFANLVAYAVVPLFYRSEALCGVPRRWRRRLRRTRRAIRASILRNRWPIAAAYAARPLPEQVRPAAA